MVKHLQKKNLTCFKKSNYIYFLINILKYFNLIISSRHKVRKNFFLKHNYINTELYKCQAFLYLLYNYLLNLNMKCQSQENLRLASMGCVLCASIIRISYHVPFFSPNKIPVSHIGTTQFTTFRKNELFRRKTYLNSRKRTGSILRLNFCRRI